VSELDFTDEQPKPKLVQHEWRDQRAYAVFLSKALPIDAYWTGLDMGRSRSSHEGQLRKLRGCKAGVPDFLIIWQGIALWLECKAGSALSPAQKITREALLANGHQWALVRSMDDIELACLAARIPLRASVDAWRERAPPKPAKHRNPHSAPRATASKGFVKRAANRGILF
jgi:hypothetical protein